MKRDIKLVDRSGADLVRWSQTNPKILKKIIEVIDAIASNPFEGIGKPELLKHEYKGKWSRRITDEHRIIYAVIDEEIHIYACFGHYT
ncbi:MAG: Txe/YoeB family addiction module toxin [Bacteroidetes bacterium]|nr:MAG: Txe/YoeB family addiction module toxin [Bacteroidota bacterium]